MPSAGDEVVACWRESGAWWAGEKYLQITRTRAGTGKIRDQFKKIPTPWSANGTGEEYVDIRNEDYELRPRKIRDEKVNKACGYVFEPKSVALATDAALTYAPLHLLSGYSFGMSLLFAEEIPRRCAQLGIGAAALTDYFSLAGVVEFCKEARKCGVKPLIGCTVELDIGGQLVLLVRSKRGYVQLSKFLTECHLGQPRGYPLATLETIRKYSLDWICLTGGLKGALARPLASRDYRAAEDLLKELASIFGSGQAYVEIDRMYSPWERELNQRAEELAQHLGIRCVAGGAITHARPEHFPAQDVLVCSETLCLVDEIVGRKPKRAKSQPSPKAPPDREINGERFLRSPNEMAKMYSDRPDLLAATLFIADSCDDDVLPSRTHLPEFSQSAYEHLRAITWAGAKQHYGDLSPALKKRIEKELHRIQSLRFSEHFLIAYDFCDWARTQGILFSARGSVVDSVVAFCLGFSRIDAFRHHLHFDRFLPADGSKRPDIDIDFEAKHRNDIRVYIENKYGREHVAGIAAFGAFCVRGIIREVGKALGLPPSVISFLSKRVHGGIPPSQLESALAKRPELMQSGIPQERFAWVFRLAEILQDVPRNLRAHSSGMILSREPICETAPLVHSGSEQATGPLQIIQWDKRSSKYFFDKFDILCLRGQDVLGGVEDHIPGFSSNNAPIDDPECYRAMRAGELIGIPQSASPAMRQAHMRIQTNDIVDASLVQAGIRPGVGGAVKINELISRRRGLTKYEFEHPELEKILGNTYGIVVFQEQIDQLLQTFCRYSSGEAEDIREQIHKKRREDYGQAIKQELLARIRQGGISDKLSEHIFDLIAGFKGYGFAQGHALAFAEISVRSIYCQQNFPAEYFAALLSAQPAGYYGPRTIANEARSRGIVILPPSVQCSKKAFTVEDVRSEMDPQIVFPNGAVRTGLMQIKGLSGKLMESIVENQPFTSLWHFLSRTKPNQDELEFLILSGALADFHPNRKMLLWSLPELMSYVTSKDVLPNSSPSLADIPEHFSEIENSVLDRASMGIDIKHHLMQYERNRIRERGGLTSAEAKKLPPKTKAFAVGNPIRLRFPPTPSGKRVVFFDLEDETGLLNVTCFDRVYQLDGHSIICSPYVTVVGEAQDRDGHTAFLAKRVFPYDPQYTRSQLSNQPLPVSVGDFLVG